MTEPREITNAEYRAFLEHILSLYDKGAFVPLLYHAWADIDQNDLADKVEFDDPSVKFVNLFGAMRLASVAVLDSRSAQEFTYKGVNLKIYLANIFYDYLTSSARKFLVERIVTL